jgi:hypothetical protein
MVTLTRKFGAPAGAPGIEVTEQPGINALASQTYGTTALFGVLKRGPMGVAVPINSKNEYNQTFGDPKDSTWHLFKSSNHQAPDFVDGYFSAGGSAGQLWITRLDVGGKAKKASVQIKSRTGDSVLRVIAANEGRWAGYKIDIPFTPVIYATTRTFTILAPGVESNELIDAIVTFSTQLGGNIGSEYKIVSNTAANPDSGEVIVTVGSQFDLLGDGVAGPTALTGTATYERYSQISGTSSFAATKALTGTVSLNNYTIVGQGTLFTTELVVGSTIYESGEARVVTSITSNTTLTIDAPFSNEGSGLTLDTDNTTLVGSLDVGFESAYTTDLVVGQMVYALIDGELQGRKVASITSDSELELESGFTEELSAGTVIQVENYLITGTDTAFDTEVQVGQYIIDPNRQGDRVLIVAINSATEVEIDTQFSSSFTDAELTKQNQLARVQLSPSDPLEGLSIEITQGTRFPNTHFGMKVYFNGSLAMPAILDASLDPEDPEGLFIENLVNNRDVVARSAGENYTRWITVESLWNSAYTTAPQNDVRPANGSGEILVIDNNRIYTGAEFDFDLAVGRFFYPDPYVQPRSFFRIQKAQAPIELEGTVSATAGSVIVTGVSTNFETVFVPGDYFYEPETEIVRRILSIQSDTQITVDSIIVDGIAASSTGYKLGWIEVDRSYNLASITEVGNRFLVEYPQQMVGGYDGDTSVILPYYFTKFADIDRNHLENATLGRNVGLIRIATPGENSLTVQKAFAQYAQAKAYEYRAEIPNYVTTTAAAESFINNDLGRNDFISVAYPSFGWIASPLGTGERFISLSGEIMGGESRVAVVNEGYHVPYAGLSASLARVLRLPFNPTSQDESTLNLAGIQPIKSNGGNATVFGARCPSISTVFTFLHVRRIQSHFVQYFQNARPLLAMLFRPNQPLSSEYLQMIFDNFANTEYRKGTFSKQLSRNQAVQIVVGLGTQGVSSVGDSKDKLIESLNGDLAISMRYFPAGIVERIKIDLGPDILVEQWGG